MNNKFSNQEITPDHLDCVQKARCHELWIYLNQLCIKYSFPVPSHNVLSECLMSDWPSTAVRMALTSSMWAGQGIPSLSLTLSDDEKTKYRVKFERMIQAKRAYEKVGGHY